MTAKDLTSGLYFGRVMHRRLRPFRHRFDYRIYAFLFDLDELGRLDGELPLFSHNRRNVFSLRDGDHGPRDGSTLKPWAQQLCARQGIDLEGGRVELLCLPRLFGYAFNPLSLWFCYGPGRDLKAVIYEVRNTFGQQHCYLLPVTETLREGEVLKQDCDKGFYVSPFLPMQAHYRFRLSPPAARLSLLIRQSVPEGEILLASWTGRRAPLGPASLVRALCLYPLLSFKVMLAIHWQALRLWLRGAVFHRRPPPPEVPVTLPASGVQRPANGLGAEGLRGGE